MKYANERCNQQEYVLEGRKFIKFTGVCIYSGRLFDVIVPAEEVEKANRGKLSIEDALKSLSAEEREFLVSGISPFAR